jgi:hypothetical protein
LLQQREKYCHRKKKKKLNQGSGIRTKRVKRERERGKRKEERERNKLQPRTKNRNKLTRANSSGSFGRTDLTVFCFNNTRRNIFGRNQISWLTPFPIVLIQNWIFIISRS